MVPEQPSEGPSSIAIIGDLVRSRRYAHERRALVQGRLSASLDDLNEQYGTAVLSGFLITAGDEFQGLLGDGTVLPDIIWDMEASLRGVGFRLGIGCGVISTPLQERAVGMDGPAWYMARDAVDLAHLEGRNGGVFSGFGVHEDLLLNGLARVLRHQRDRWTTKQFEILSLMRSGKAQVEVAEALGITRQAVSKHVRSAGWDAYLEGEAAWRDALRAFDFTSVPSFASPFPTGSLR